MYKTNICFTKKGLNGVISKYCMNREHVKTALNGFHIELELEEQVFSGKTWPVVGVRETLGRNVSFLKTFGIF